MWLRIIEYAAGIHPCWVFHKSHRPYLDHIGNHLSRFSSQLSLSYLIYVEYSHFRKKAFEEDLAHYLGEDWQSTPKSAALENYIEHLQDLETEHPTMLLAYVYHLYLGLLSGGQILAKKRKMFGESKYLLLLLALGPCGIKKKKQKITAYLFL